MSAQRQRGFTLIEMIVAITISSIVVVFAAMFIVAPVDAFEANSRRAALVADGFTAWPRIQADLREALPNSVRVRRNGNFVVLEMLRTAGYARYTGTPTQNIAIAGTAQGMFGNNYAPGATINFRYLSAGNLGQEAYTQSTSMSTLLNSITLAPNGVTGEATANLSAPTGITAASPRNRLYLVDGPVAYLCDETQGTIRRYDQYPVAANITAHDTPAEFGGAPSTVVARGLTSCEFGETIIAGRPQRVTVRLTASRGTDVVETVTMLHATYVENLP